MEAHRSDRLITRIALAVVTATSPYVALLVIVGGSVAAHIWVERHPFGALLTTAVALVALGLRQARRRRRLAALEESGALAAVPRERARAWSALAELYLDTDVTRSFPYITKTLAASPYAERELWEILADEVGPHRLAEHVQRCRRVGRLE